MAVRGCLAAGELLEDPAWAVHPLYTRGVAFATGAAHARAARFWFAKITHLGSAATAGAALLVPALWLIAWGLGRLLLSG